MSEPLIDLLPIELVGLPLPPSSNNQYRLVRSNRSGRIIHAPSKELREFQNNMKFYFNRMNFLHSTQLRDKIRCWIDNGLVLQVLCVFMFHRNRLFTKENVPKKLDCSNRIKALHDQISDHLQFDDRYFFSIEAMKFPIPSDHKECSVVKIEPYRRLIEFENFTAKIL